MIEKIEKEPYKSISTPASEVIDVIKKKKSEKANICVAEIGVGIGATTVEILKCLSKEDRLYLFDFNETIKDLLKDLEDLNLNGVELIGIGNSKKIYDSYVWNLLNLASEEKNINEGLFDVVYLDGAHAYLQDLSACAVLKLLLRKEGYLIFDDMYWTLASYVQRFPKSEAVISTQYTQEQLESPHIAKIVNVIMRNDCDFEEIFLNEDKSLLRTIWKKNNDIIKENKNSNSNKILHDGLPVVLYGGGLYGRMMLDIVKRQGVDVISFCDSDNKKIGKSIEKIPILSLKEIMGTCKEYNIIICIKDLVERKRVNDFLIQKGINEKNIFDYSQYI